MTDFIINISTSPLVQYLNHLGELFCVVFLISLVIMSLIDDFIFRMDKCLKSFGMFIIVIILSTIDLIKICEIIYFIPTIWTLK